VIVQSFHDLNEYAESMIVLHPSREKDDTGPLTVSLSPLTMETGLLIIITSDTGSSFFDS
jgi:hypothetical protein